jgi:hypothetical protein
MFVQFYAMNKSIRHERQLYGMMIRGKSIKEMVKRGLSMLMSLLCVTVMLCKDVKVYYVG